MPGFPNSQGHEGLGASINGYHEEDITRQAASSQLLTSSTMASNVKYIPPQMDPLVGTSTRAMRNSPLRLLVQDAGVFVTMLPYLPYIFLPLRAKNEDGELHPNLRGARDLLLQGCLCVFETNLLVMVVPTLLLLPGVISSILMTTSILFICLLAYPMEGPRIAYSNMDKQTQAMAEQHQNERWLFVNGCAVGSLNLQKNVDRISKTFGRAVIGIHNKTYGLPADILECLIQRCFSYKTLDVRITYSYVKAVLLDPTVKKVVLIGHSQGGIIISLVLDQLFAELPVSCISKLEIYTFGSAASHFSNPLENPQSGFDASRSLSLDNTVHMDAPSPPKHVISHIEHYANEYDMIPRWGVLHCVQDVLNTRYAGSVFVRVGASGHMFNQHYMDAMFPNPDEKTPMLADSFLDTVLNVNESLAMQRENTAIGNVGVMRRDSGLEFGNGQVIHDGLRMLGHSGASNSGDAVMTFARTQSGRLLAEEAQGKTVRELSRLWRYQGGRSPYTPTPFLKDDHAHGLKGFTSITAKNQFLNGKSKNDKAKGSKHQRATTELASPTRV